jgi:hypothetical protein
MLLVMILLVGHVPLFWTFNEKYDILETLELVGIGYLVFIKSNSHF